MGGIGLSWDEGVQADLWDPPPGSGRWASSRSKCGTDENSPALGAGVLGDQQAWHVLPSTWSASGLSERRSPGRGRQRGRPVSRGRGGGSAHVKHCERC